jgi:hypothetical protein
MMDRNDLCRLFAVRHRIFSPSETIDGAPDERLAVMENFANFFTTLLAQSWSTARLTPSATSPLDACTKQCSTPTCRCFWETTNEATEL